MPLTRKTTYYGCAKRGCCKINPDYMVFETGWPNNIKTWCLDHIPLITRIKMRLRKDD